MKYLKNEALPVLLEDWKGNPYKDGQFQYPEEPFKPSFRKLLKWQLSANPQQVEKKADDWRPNVHPGDDYLYSEEDFIVWLGHASFLIQLNGIRLITDPVLYSLPLVPRYVDLPYSISELKKIDYILLSHDHRDHCDKKTLRELLKHNQPKKILAPLKLSSVIGNWVNGTTIEEAAWYQSFHIGSSAIEISFLPSRHWCRRGLFDFNQVLWGSFIIRKEDKTIYFAADSGPGNHFEAIGRLFPGIDIAMIGIGAYKPDYMMSEIHTSPEEAFEAFQQLGAKKMIPMHYGTYDLADEPLSEPFYRIQHCFAEKNWKESLLLLDVNKALYI